VGAGIGAVVGGVGNLVNAKSKSNKIMDAQDQKWGEFKYRRQNWLNDKDQLFNYLNDKYFKK